MAAKKKATPAPKPAPRCKVDACDARVYERGLCVVHWTERRDLADAE
jgi:hypothetical protein